MARNRRLLTDADFTEAMERQTAIRVFRNDQVVDSGGVVTRYDDRIVVIQRSVSELEYHDRKSSEFFEMPRR